MALTADLTICLKLDQIYDTSGLPGEASDYLHNSSRKIPRANTRIRLNRLLLEAAIRMKCTKPRRSLIPDREIYIPILRIRNDLPRLYGRCANTGCSLPDDTRRGCDMLIPWRMPGWRQVPCDDQRWAVGFDFECGGGHAEAMAEWRKLRQGARARG